MIQGLGVKHKPLLPSDDHERVEHWTETLLPERDGHFERPLKEVRVGESPSRPWGISLPLDHPTGELPAQHGPAGATEHSEGPKETSTPSLQLPRMTFTGPVFIGYSQEQAAFILRRDEPR